MLSGDGTEAGSYSAQRMVKMKPVTSVLVGRRPPVRRAIAMMIAI